MTSVFIGSCFVNHSEEHNPPCFISDGGFSTTSREDSNQSRLVLLRLSPLSQFYTDLQGRILRLWKYKGTLIASILHPDGNMNVLSGKKVHNALQPSEVDSVLLERIERVGQRAWHLAYLEETKELHVWPYLRAAGGEESLKIANGKLDGIRDHLDTKDKPKEGITHLGAAERGDEQHIGELRQYRLSCRNATLLAKKEYTEVCRDLNKTGVNRSEAKTKELEGRAAFALEVLQNAKVLLMRMSSQKFPLTRHLLAKADEKDRSRLSPNQPSSLDPKHPFHPKNYSEPKDRKTWGPIDALVFMVKKQAEEKAAKKPPEGGGGGGGGGKELPVKPGPTASNRLDAKYFKEMVQQNRLAASYNASHPDKQIVQRGSSGGSIGGVGNEVAIIEGLFESLSSFEEDQHIFYIPSVDGRRPFRDSELKQIIRELSVGIYVYDTIPFFSLHFNQDCNLYPVMHPAYQNTRVGKVISMLDYYMKGFLNGAVYNEAFLREWQSSKTHDRAILEKNAIDLREYSKKAFPEGNFEYYSLKELIQLQEIEEDIRASIAKDAGAPLPKQEDPPIFSEYSGFRSSFRIIAKQNSFKKTGILFELDGSFDVFYTIEPDPAYQVELEKYRCLHGKDPLGYKRLVKAYDKMKRLIETVMPRLPMFRDLFEQLKVINFFSYYLKTLRKAQKIPVLGPVFLQENVAAAAAAEGIPPAKRGKMEEGASSSSSTRTTARPVSTFPLFPYLPIRQISHARVPVEFNSTTLQEALFDETLAFLKSAPADLQPPEALINKLLLVLENRLKGKISFTLGKDEREVESRREFIITFLRKARTEANEFVPMFMRKEVPKMQQACRSIQEELPQLSEVRNKILGSISDAEYELSSVRCNPGERYASKSEIQKFITERKEKLQELDREIAKEAARLKTIENLIKKVFAEQCDPILFFIEQASLPFHEVSSHINSFTRLSPDELYQNQRVVGGCGLMVDNKPLSPVTRGAAFAAEIVQAVEPREDEQFCPLSIPGASSIEGYGFSLHIVDEPAAQESEYTWMEHLLPPEGLASESARKSLFRAIAQEDQEAFTKELSPELLGSKDIHGVALIHRAAESNNIFFLQQLIALGANFSQQDQDGFTALHYAARTGKVENCNFLLGTKESLLEAVAKNNATALYVAVQHNMLDVVKFLMAQGANPNIAVTHGMTPLISAVHHNHLSIAQELLSHKSVYVDVTLEDGSTALFVAVNLMFPSMVELLVAKGADVNKQRKDSFTPLLLAFKSSSLQICSMLFENPKFNQDYYNKSRRTPLHFAVERSSPVYTELLLAFEASIFMKSWDGETPLMAAVRAHNNRAVWLLLNHCEYFTPSRLKGYIEEKNIQGETALSLAIKTRQGDQITAILAYKAERPSPKILVDKMCAAHTKMNYLSNYVLGKISRGDLNQEDLDRAYYIACKHGYFTARYALSPLELQPREIVDEQGWSATHFYAMHDYVDGMEEFLRTHPEDILRITKDGLSLAAIAAKHGKTQVLKKLVAEMIERGISFDKQYHGNHLVIAAMESRNVETLDAVCFYMPTSNLALDEQRRTPAHFAAIWGDVEMLDLFRRRSGNLVAVDAYGKTPLHYALEYGREKVLKYFLEHAHEIQLPKDVLSSITDETSPDTVQKMLRFVDCNAPEPSTGKTAIFKAIEVDNFPVFMILCAHGANLTVKSKEGATPFLTAVELDRVEYVSQLYEKAFQDETEDGKNALHIAAFFGHEQTLLFLLSRGMDVSKKTREGKTALDLAQEKRLSNIVTILSGKKSVLLSYKRHLIEALRKGKKEGFLQLAKALPLNQPMVFNVDGKELCIPLLHLIDFLVHSKDTTRDFVAAFLEIPGANRDVVSPKGLTLDHRMALRGAELDFEKVDVSKKDAQGSSLLHYLAASDEIGSENQLEKALIKTDMVDIETKDGITPLFAAIESKNEQKVSLLLKKGANPNHLSKKRLSPLLLAIKTEQFTIVNILCSRGADVSLQCLDTKITPLHLAVEQGNFGLVQFLVDSGADVNRKMLHGVAPIHYAARRGDMTILFYLMRAGAEYFVTDDNGWTIAHHAALSERPEIFEFLVLHSVSLNKGAFVKKGSRRPTDMNGITPLHIAAQLGNVLAVHTLLALGADSTVHTERQVSPLVFAGMSGNRKTVKCFVGQPVFKDPKQLFLATQMTVIHDAVSSLQLLCPSKEILQCPVDGQRTTIAHLAASNNSLKVLRYLVTQEVSLREKDFKGRTPFELALEANKPLVARYLLLETDVVDFEEKTFSGLPYLHYVCQRGFLPLAELLIQGGAPINEEDYLHRKPLHHALSQKSEPLVELLLASGAEIDVSAMREFMPKSEPGIQKIMAEYAQRRAAEPMEKSS